MEKLWLAQYPEHVPHEVDLSPYSSLQDLFLKSVNEFRNLPAFVNLGKTLTFDDMDRLTKQQTA